MDEITMNSVASPLSSDWIARIDAVAAPAAAKTKQDDQAANTFSQLLHAGASHQDVGTLSPEQMLLRQADTMTFTIGVDLGAKVAGSVSQAVNKLANMT